MPAFMAANPPRWLWMWSDEDGSDDDEDDETHANDAPEDPQNQKIKRIFEDAAGPLYRRFAYDPFYHLARGVFRGALFPTRHSWDRDMLRDTMEEWNEMVSEKGMGEWREETEGLASL